MQIVDISNPDDAQIVSTYDCGVTQGDVQVFRQADEPGRTFVGYASDTFGDGTSTCYREAQALGFDMLKDDGTGKNGTFIADVTDPLHPKTVGFVEVGQGSHNQSIHPSGNYLYNSNSDLITSIQPAIEVFDISDPGAPEVRRRARAAAAAGPRHRVARHHVLRRRQARLLGRALPGRDHRHARPRQPVDHLLLPGPDDQRLAPDGPVHDHRRERPRARVRDRRGRVRRRGRHGPVPQRRRARVRDDRRDGEATRRRSATGTSTRSARPTRSTAPAPPTSSTSTRTRRS